MKLMTRRFISGYEIVEAGTGGHSGGKARGAGERRV
jgi:hypothetical protein